MSRMAPTQNPYVVDSASVCGTGTLHALLLASSTRTDWQTMHNELTEINIYRSAVRAATSINALWDIAVDMIGHCSHAPTTIDDYRAFLLDYLDQWQSEWERMN